MVLAAIDGVAGVNDSRRINRQINQSQLNPDAIHHPIGVAVGVLGSLTGRFSAAANSKRLTRYHIAGGGPWAAAIALPNSVHARAAAGMARRIARRVRHIPALLIRRLEQKSSITRA